MAWQAYDELRKRTGLFGNWAAGGTANGFAAPTGFSLHAVALGTSLTSRCPILISESGAAAGSYIIAYDCINGTGGGSGCASTGDIGQTPFTNAGLVGPAPGSGPTPVPEPGSLPPMGTALASLSLSGRYRRTRE